MIMTMTMMTMMIVLLLLSSPRPKHSFPPVRPVGIRTTVGTDRPTGPNRPSGRSKGQVVSRNGRQRCCCCCCCKRGSIRTGRRSIEDRNRSSVTISGRQELVSFSRCYIIRAGSRHDQVVAAGVATRTRSLTERHVWQDQPSATLQPASSMTTHASIKLLPDRRRGRNEAAAAKRCE
jgi:hypothetical protein